MIGHLKLIHKILLKTKTTGTDDPFISGSTVKIQKSTTSFLERETLEEIVSKLVAFDISYPVPTQGTGNTASSSGSNHAKDAKKNFK